MAVIYPHFIGSAGGAVPIPGSFLPEYLSAAPEASAETWGLL